MSQSSVYAEKVMEDLDALLADLQSTTANIGYTHQQPAQSPAPVQTRDTGVSQHQQQVGGVNLRASSTSSSSPRTSGSGVGGGGVHHHHHHHQGAAAGSRASQTPPPLPPPPHDIPDTIPPPQQFGDQQQPLYEAQNVRRDTTPNTSYNSSFNNSNSYNRRSGSSDPPQSPYYTHRAEPSPGPGPVPATSQPHPGGSSMISNNLSELDQLLSDLNSAQFMAEVDKKHSTSSSQSGSTVTQSSSSQQATWNPPGKQPPPPVAPKPNRGGGGGNTSVDNLLDQLETSNSPAGPHGGYPVQTNAVNGSYATVGESHSQSYSYSDSSHSGGGGGGPGMGGPHSPAQIMSSQVVISPAPAQVISPAPQPSSAATQELDDLMQSLSGFKMKENQQQQQPQSGQIHASVPQSPQPYPPGAQVHIQPQPQPPRSPSPGSEPSYAKPHKSRNLSQSGSSSANSSMQMSGGQNVQVGNASGVQMGNSSVQMGNSSVQMGHSVQMSNNSMQGNNMAGGAAQGGQLESMLGDLQSDLSKQGVETKTKGLCAACNQPVVGQFARFQELAPEAEQIQQVITALGKIWHIEHFTCDHCHTVLGTKNFYERDGVAYCERDYHSLFAPRCAYCNGPITDKCVTALDRTWHPEHFFCAQCGRPFGEDGFHEKDGKAYCRADFFEMFAPKCGGCGRAIVDNYISALNRHWHPECFACFECHHPFAGGKFFDYEGLPYCETHYHAKRGSLCAGCQKPISGRCITAMSRKFHPEHFVCAFCLKQLNKGTFKEQNDRPYCHPCFVKLFG